MTTEELLQELKAKLELLQKFEAVANSLTGMKKGKKKKPMSQATKDKISKKRKAAWAEKKKAEKAKA